MVAKLLNGRISNGVIDSARSNSVYALGITENCLGEGVGVILISGYTVDVVKEVVSCGNGLALTRRIGIDSSALVNKHDNVGIILTNLVKADHISCRDDGQHAVNVYRSADGNEEGDTGGLNVGILVYVGTAGGLGLGERPYLLVGAHLGLDLVAVYRVGFTLGVITEAAELIRADVASHNLLNLQAAGGVLKSLCNIVKVVIMHLGKVANGINILVKGEDGILHGRIAEVLC